MREGFWIRIKDGKVFEVDDHAGDFMYGDLPKKMRLNELYKDLVEKGIEPEGKTGKNRRKIVLAIMNKGFIRVRGHGNYVTFEFTGSAGKTLDAILEFGDDWFAPLTSMYIVHLTKDGIKKDEVTLNFGQFLDRYEEDKQLILKTAKRKRLT